MERSARGGPPQGTGRTRRARRGVAGFALLALGLTAAAPAAGQDLARGLPAAGRFAAAGGDSTAVARTARDDQRDFERERRARLAIRLDGPGAPCDEVVGRFCWRHDDPGSDDPPPEPDGVAALRERLLDRLASAASLRPADGWLAGQRVRYLIEAGRPGRAVDVARGCGAAGWWCRALEGWALHEAGDEVSAEAAFAAALASMPPSQRDAWEDPTWLLDARERAMWRGLSAGARRAFQVRLWWLADPWWSTPANERHVEHLARRTRARVLAEAANAFGVGWGDDLEEILVRYGWPAGWSRVRSSAAALGRAGPPPVTGHDPPGGRRFVPPWDALVAPSVAPAEWLDAPAPRSTYALSGARRFVVLDHQLAAFRRAGGARIVVGWDLAPDSLPPDQPVDVALVVARGPGEEPRIGRVLGARAGSLALSVAGGPAVVSLEARSRGTRFAGRARHGLRLPPLAGPGASDLLLLRPGAALPDSLPAAEVAARGSSRVAADERLGVFWEIYPPEAGGSARVTIALRDERGGLWHGLRTLLGGGGPRSGVALDWSEPVPAGVEVYPRSVEIALPGLPPGEYALELTVAWPDGTRSGSTRRILVER